jgi:hypothetical protein
MIMALTTWRDNAWYIVIGMDPSVEDVWTALYPGRAAETELLSELTGVFKPMKSRHILSKIINESHKSIGWAKFAQPTYSAIRANKDEIALARLYDEVLGLLVEKDMDGSGIAFTQAEAEKFLNFTPHVEAILKGIILVYGSVENALEDWLNNGAPAAHDLDNTAFKGLLPLINRFERANGIRRDADGYRVAR